MQNLVAIWLSLSLGRRLVVIGTTLAMFMAVLTLTRMAGTPGMTLLYAGLDGPAAGQVISALDQRNVTYEVRGDSVYVSGDQRDALRMALAGEGLPTAGAAGYELLDSLSGFNTTNQMFDAAYWRAKEGELARTILASPQVRAARVHIAQSPAAAFRPESPPTASVTLVTSTGTISEQQAQAIRHLVAAAVSGMKPDDVAVIDSQGGLVPLRSNDPAMSPDAMDRAADIRRNVERLLEARVGAGRAVVEVAVELVTESEQITERKLDPQGRVAISSSTEENTSSASQPGGDVTVASNLPEGDGAGGGNGQSQSSETREQVNFEVSETQRELIKVPGAIRKLSVAVLVDNLRSIAEDGTVTETPRPEEELAVLRELVASAVGLDEARGDVLTLRALPFDQPPVQGTLVEAGFFDGLNYGDLLPVLQIIVLGIVTLVLGLFVLRPLLSRPPLALPAPGAGGALALPGGAGGLGEAGVGLGALPALGQAPLSGEIDEAPGGFALPGVANFDVNGMIDEDNDPVSRLRKLIEERQTESVEILRGWMEAAEERG